MSYTKKCALQHTKSPKETYMGKTQKISKPLLLLIITEKKLIFDICDTHQHTKTRNTHTKKSSARTGGDQHLGRVEGRGFPPRTYQHTNTRKLHTKKVQHVLVGTKPPKTQKYKSYSVSSKSIKGACTPVEM